MNWKLWIAQGFGLGRIPVAPGTFGSGLGFALFAALLFTGSWLAYLSAIVISIPLCAWLCGNAEKYLKQKDPGSVVLDEIIAIPLCFVGLLVFLGKNGLPKPGYFFGSHGWIITVAVFGLFRLFDVWKPWPVRQSQCLPGGWGVTVDDLLAAVYVNIVTVGVALLWPSLLSLS